MIRKIRNKNKISRSIIFVHWPNVIPQSTSQNTRHSARTFPLRKHKYQSKQNQSAFRTEFLLGKWKWMSVNASFACFKNQMYGSIEANSFNVCSLIIEHIKKMNRKKNNNFRKSYIYKYDYTYIVWHTDNIGALHANRLNFSARHMKCFLDEWCFLHNVQLLHFYVFLYTEYQKSLNIRSHYS